MSVDARNRAVTFGQQFLIAKHSILVVHAGHSDLDHGRLDAQGVAEYRGPVVPAGNAMHDQEHAVALEISVVVSHRFEHFDSCPFEVLQVIGTVAHALTVGFVIPDGQFELVLVLAHALVRCDDVGQVRGRRRSFVAS